MPDSSQKIDFLNFNNPTLGQVVFDRMVGTVAEFITEQPKARYRIMIGSDSKGNGQIDLVSVVAVHRVGRGGRYFWHRSVRYHIKSLRQKIYTEVDASLRLAAIFLPAFRQKLINAGNGKYPFDFQIHVDVGKRGETRDLVAEITGMVTAYGYSVFVKPESVAATTVADRHVR